MPRTGLCPHPHCTQGAGGLGGRGGGAEAALCPRPVYPQLQVKQVLRRHQIKPHWMFALDNLMGQAVQAALTLLLTGGPEAGMGGAVLWDALGSAWSWRGGRRRRHP